MKNPKKVLCVMGYFELADDFTGKLSDALRALADYHETIGLSSPDRHLGDDELTDQEKKLDKEFADSIFGRWLKNREKGNRLTAAVGLSEYVDGEWVKLDDFKKGGDNE